MTDQELQQLARKYAEQNPPQGLKDEALKRVLIGTNVEIFGKFLIWLTKTHCIAIKDDVVNQHSFYMQRMKEVSSARQTNRAKAIALENCFGSELFEERSGK